MRIREGRDDCRRVWTVCGFVIDMSAGGIERSAIGCQRKPSNRSAAPEKRPPPPCSIERDQLLFDDRESGSRIGSAIVAANAAPSRNGSISMRSPKGGRLLQIENPMPRSGGARPRRSRAASTPVVVTRVPSKSETTRENCSPRLYRRASGPRCVAGGDNQAELRPTNTRSRRRDDRLDPAFGLRGSSSVRTGNRDEIAAIG